MAIQCTSRFQSSGEKVLKSFRDILLTDIIPKIKKKANSSSLEAVLLETEQQILKLISESKEIPASLVTQYVEQHAHYRNESKVPFGFTALVYNNLTMHP